MSVWNAMGEQVATLVNGLMSTGNHTVPFNGAVLSSGMYFYRLEAGVNSVTKKMLLLK
ncbi:T9SS type A sorting domain-containing protein [candidate division KSB1 bacterium]|nr:T9SS type A sorting domain-containing protein [candidate division KSB1 bacterium]